MGEAMSAAAIEVFVKKTAAADRRGCPSRTMGRDGGVRIDFEDRSVCSYDKRRIKDWGGKEHKEKGQGAEEDDSSVAMFPGGTRNIVERNLSAV